MKAREREARCCQLLCGRERAPNNPYKLCYTCLKRLYEITGAAKKRRQLARTIARQVAA